MQNTIPILTLVTGIAGVATLFFILSSLNVGNDLLGRIERLLSKTEPSSTFHQVYLQAYRHNYAALEVPSSGFAVYKYVQATNQWDLVDDFTLPGFEIVNPNDGGIKGDFDGQRIRVNSKRP